MVIDCKTNAIDKAFEKQKIRLEELKNKLNKIHEDRLREHLRIVKPVKTTEVKAAMQNRYKFTVYEFKKKNRTKIADKKAVKARGKFSVIVNENIDIIEKFMELMRM